MVNLSRFVKQLRRERDRVESQLRALNAALAAFVGIYSGKLKRRSRKLSAAARRRISRAQKARWKRVREAKK